MPCLPGKKIFVTRLFGKRIQNKNKKNVTQQNIYVSNKPPPSGNAKTQKLIAKHIFECIEKRKGEDGKKQILQDLIN